jgi:leucyl-tRNA synthetase
VLYVLTLVDVQSDLNHLGGRIDWRRSFVTSRLHGHGYKFLSN